jgi:hypothetical protein
MLEQRSSAGYHPSQVADCARQDRGSASSLLPRGTPYAYNYFAELQHLISLRCFLLLMLSSPDAAADVSSDLHKLQTMLVLLLMAQLLLILVAFRWLVIGCFPPHFVETRVIIDC